MIRKSVSVPVFMIAGLLFGAAIFAALPAPSASGARDLRHWNPREVEAQFTVVGKAPQPQQNSASAQVKIDNFSFGPPAIAVPVGATVTWTNRDDIPHTVVSENKIFKSKVLDTDDKFSFAFEKPGTYAYFCSVHPKMTGKVIVR